MSKSLGHHYDAILAEFRCVSISNRSPGTLKPMFRNYRTFWPFLEFNYLQFLFQHERKYSSDDEGPAVFGDLNVHLSVEGRNQPNCFRCPDCGRVPPGRNIKQQLAVKRTVNKWKKKGPTGGASSTNGSNDSRDKKSSVVVAKQSRNQKVRNDGTEQFSNRNFV